MARAIRTGVMRSKLQMVHTRVSEDGGTHVRLNGVGLHMQMEIHQSERVKFFLEHLQNAFTMRRRGVKSCQMIWQSNQRRTKKNYIT